MNICSVGAQSMHIGTECFYCTRFDRTYFGRKHPQESRRVQNYSHTLKCFPATIPGITGVLREVDLGFWVDVEAVEGDQARQRRRLQVQRRQRGELQHVFGAL